MNGPFGANSRLKIKKLIKIVTNLGTFNILNLWREAITFWTIGLSVGQQGLLIRARETPLWSKRTKASGALPIGIDEST